LITPGTILIEDGTSLPKCFELESCAYPGAWMPMKEPVNPYEFERELGRAGWEFFYIAGVIRTSACGFNVQKNLRTALKRMIASVKLHKCNSLEIDEVKSRSFLGMLPYVSVSAHSRHIQKRTQFRVDRLETASDRILSGQKEKGDSNV
jgi:hypothetical protein